MGVIKRRLLSLVILACSVFSGKTTNPESVDGGTVHVAYFSLSNFKPLTMLSVHRRMKMEAGS